MGLKTPDLPDVPPDEVMAMPFFDRTKFLTQHWVDWGFGSPKLFHLIYIFKLIIYVVGGFFIAWGTSDLGPLSEFSSWWTEPIFYQKLLVWTVFFEVIGLGSSSGPLAFKFDPMIGGFLYLGRRNTLRIAPWPDKRDISFDRVAITLSPSATDSAPETTAAATSPIEWPTTAIGSPGYSWRNRISAHSASATGERIGSFHPPTALSSRTNARSGRRSASFSVITRMTTADGSQRRSGRTSSTSPRSITRPPSRKTTWSATSRATTPRRWHA